MMTMDMDIEAWFQREVREMRKAIPRTTVAKKRPRNVRMIADIIDKRKHPEYRAGRVITYTIDAGGYSTMRVEWIQPEVRSPRAGRGESRITIRIHENPRYTYVKLSPTLVKKLRDMRDENSIQAKSIRDEAVAPLYILIGVLDGKRI